MQVKWRGKPVWILRRTSSLASLSEVEGQLRDPGSAEEQQPSYARSTGRSVKPEVVVLVGLCTHLAAHQLWFGRASALVG